MRNNERKNPQKNSIMSVFIINLSFQIMYFPVSIFLFPVQPLHQSMLPLLQLSDFCSLILAAAAGHGSAICLWLLAYLSIPSWYLGDGQNILYSEGQLGSVSDSFLGFVFRQRQSHRESDVNAVFKNGNYLQYYQGSGDIWHFSILVLRFNLTNIKFQS